MLCWLCGSILSGLFPLSGPSVCVAFFPSGVYGFEDYLMALPHAVLHLQSGPLVERREKSALFAALPSSIRNLIQRKVGFD